MQIIKLANMRTPRPRGVPAWGACVHTTGSGIPKRAQALKRATMSIAIEIYTDPDMEGFPHYVINGEGAIVQVCEEALRAAHVGRIVNGVDRREQYMSGAWEKMIPASLLDRWRRAWPGKKHPYALFPSKSPNEDFLGIELIPMYPPPSQGTRFTRPQMDSLVDLLRDMAVRNKWPAKWATTSRLVGHEDVGILDRFDRNGTWDPGNLREQPYFDFAGVRRALTS